MSPMTHRRLRSSRLQSRIAMKSTVIANTAAGWTALEYAKNEVMILQQLDHPHIVKVVQVFPFDTAVYSVALSLVSGRTLKQMIEYVGAFFSASVHAFSRCISQ
mmetsp:Transcript_20417/g.29105  ORF Transcript_20417/g.29105 Transcript_20417/m.29105 type:complete len:104 (+) Transcript_20417:212-523(+)